MRKFDVDLWKKTELLRHEYSSSFLPPWPCPYCWKSSLQLEENFKYSVTPPEDINAEDYSYPFTGHLFCNHCKGQVSVNGWFNFNPGWHPLPNEEPLEINIEYFTPMFFVPNLRLFFLETYYPEEVTDILNKSFALYFANIHATACLLRGAVEKLLDLPILGKIPREKKGKFITLDDRIKLIEKADIKDHLMAVKWIGNSGAHFDESSFSQIDLLDGFKVIHYVLEKIFSPDNDSHINEITQKINKNKGVRRDSEQL